MKSILGIELYISTVSENCINREAKYVGHLFKDSPLIFTQPQLKLTQIYRYLCLYTKDHTLTRDWEKLSELQPQIYKAIIT